jgi:two-component system, chemotaxis family, CheB/CheR fusion protein
METFSKRLRALATTHDLLLASEWRGASLEAIAQKQLAPHLGDALDHLELTGPWVIVSAEIATPLGLVLHELATNAAKYGALSVPAGRVRLSWQTRDLEDGVRMLEITWTERGGPPVEASVKAGVGSDLIKHAIPGARVEQTLAPEGLVCSISLRLRPGSSK